MKEREGEREREREEARFERKRVEIGNNGITLQRVM